VGRGFKNRDILLASSPSLTLFLEKVPLQKYYFALGVLLNRRLI